jgi:hypothetical protein
LLPLLQPKLPIAPPCKTLLDSRRFLARSPPTRWSVDARTCGSGSR